MLSDDLEEPDGLVKEVLLNGLDLHSLFKEFRDTREAEADRLKIEEADRRKAEAAESDEDSKKVQVDIRQ